MNETMKKMVTNKYSQTEIARNLGCKPQAVQQWLTNGIPAGRVIPLCELLKWEITPHLLRPDLHPTPSSGIPEGVILPPKHEENLNHENQT